MTRRCFVGLIPAACMTVLTIGPADMARARDVRDAERQFVHAIEEYMALRHQLERHLLPLEMSVDADAIRRASEARAAAIRRARAGARPGDLFNAAVAELFRLRIRDGFAARPEAVAELIEEMNEHGESWRRAAVNGRFAWNTAAATPPYVLAVLPDLPAELQYRFVGPDLVLVDIVASVVVDILPDVLTLPSAQSRH